MRYRPNAAERRLYSESMRRIDEEYPKRGTPYAIRTGCQVDFVRPDGEGGIEVISGVVAAHSYGAGTGQHTFTIAEPDGSKRMVKGRNLYPNVIKHEPGEASL